MEDLCVTEASKDTRYALSSYRALHELIKAHLH